MLHVFKPYMYINMYALRPYQQHVPYALIVITVVIDNKNEGNNHRSFQNVMMTKQF